MVKVLFKDKLGNKIVEEKSGAIGLKNDKGIYCREKDFQEFITENKLGNKIRLRKGGSLWAHNDFLN